MNKLSKLLLGAAVIGGASSAFAASESSLGHYVSFGGKMAAPKEKDGNKFKKGYGAQLELGMSYDNWRFGLEGSFAKNKFKDAVKENLPVATGDIVDNEHVGVAAIGINTTVQSTRTDKSILLDRMSTTSLMANLYYDHYFNDSLFVFAGFGLGAARVKIGAIVEKTVRTWEGTNAAPDLASVAAAHIATLAAVHGAALANNTTAVAAVLNSHQGVTAGAADVTQYRESAGTTVFAWQIMAGLGFEITDNWTLMAGYKLFNTQKVKAPVVGGETKKIKYPMTHTATVNLMYRF